MKKLLKIVLLLSMFAGCSSVSLSTYDNQVGKSVKPLLGKSQEEQNIQLSIPVYTF